MSSHPLIFEPETGSTLQPNERQDGSNRKDLKIPVFFPALIPHFRTSTWITFGTLGSARILRLFIGLASSVLWARYVSKETYGQYQLVASFVGITANLCLNGLGQSLTISAAKGYDGNLLKISRVKVMATMIGSLALCGIGLYYEPTQPEISTGLFVVALVFPFYEMQKIWVAWLAGRGRLKLSAGLKTGGYVLSLAVLGLLILFDRAQLRNLIIGLMGGIGLLSCIVILFIFRTRRNRVENGETFRFGLHATAASLMATLILTDKIIISAYLSIEDLAVYSIALIFPTQGKALYSLFSQMITPRITQAPSVGEAWRYIKPKVALLWIVFFVAGIVGFVFIPIALPLLFSERYLEAAQLGKWLWLVFSLTAPATYLGNILRAQQKVKFIYAADTGHPVFLVCLFLLLIDYGLWGIMISKMINYFVVGGFYLGSFSYYLNKDAKDSANSSSRLT